MVYQKKQQFETRPIWVPFPVLMEGHKMPWSGKLLVGNDSAMELMNIRLNGESGRFGFLALA